MGDSTSEIREEIAETRERLAETAGAVAYKADVPTRVKDSIGETTERVKARIGGVLGGASSKVSEAATSVGDMGSSAQDKLSSGARTTATIARENPMGAFIGGIAAGLVLGLILPKTRFEQEKFGEQASGVIDQAAGKVAEVGHQAMDKEKEMIQRVGDRATQAVEGAGPSDRGHPSSTGATTGQAGAGGDSP